VCLECGQDLTGAYRRAPGRGVWIAAGVAAVLALGVGAGFAIGALTNDKQKKDVARAVTGTTSTVPSATSVPPLTTPTTPTAPTTPTTPTTPSSTDVPPATATPPTAPTTTPTTPTTPPTTPSSPPSSSGIAKWPAGTTAYTVVLISASTHKQANTKAREAISRGISAGVLHSSNYSSLNPGYWVVFAGQYSSASQARSHIDEFASKGFSGGYPRQVKK
jgi:hypothetical protein